MFWTGDNILSSKSRSSVIGGGEVVVLNPNVSFWVEESVG